MGCTDMQTRYDRHAYPFHHVERPQGERVRAALARYDQRQAENARRERNARRAVYAIFAGIGLAISVRLAYWSDLAALAGVL